jgi:hypothetical protein
MSAMFVIIIMLLVGLLADLFTSLWLVPMLVLGGLFKLLDRLTGAVPGTPTEDRGAKLFLALGILGIVVWFVHIYFLTERTFAPK